MRLLPAFPLLLAAVAALASSTPALPDAPDATVSKKPVRLMAVGDSITAGGDFFATYRFPLWEKLFAAGYVVEFVGTQSSPARIGPLAHEGYGGKTTEYLAEIVPAHFRKHPADIVLLHSGHNHFVEENPVPGIVSVTESLIAAFRAVNPRVTVLLGQVIPAGKLPKYAYIPELNTALAALAARLDTPGQRVVLVDHASSFDWAADTVDDKVHPNTQGAEKMAEAWFAALKTVLPPPPRVFAPRQIAYKTFEDSSLTLHVFDPPSASSPAGFGKPRPAILFFFGGGWTHGTPVQWYPECNDFARRGFVAISADYRIVATHDTTPFDAVADARDAFRWVQDHASELGVDPARIVLAGASAGGHLAAVTALTTPPGDRAAPAGLLLWYPVLDTSENGHGHPQIGPRFAEISPLHLLEAHAPRLPPTLIFVGTADTIAPETTARAFQTQARTAGRECEVIAFPGGKHPLYAYREGGGPLRDATLDAARRFLAALPAFGPVH